MIWITQIVFLTVLIVQLCVVNKTSLFFLSFFRTIFWCSVLGIVLYYVYLTYAQYSVWVSAGAPYVFFLPPYRSVFYLLGYHFVRFLLNYFVSFLFAVFFLIISILANKRFNNRFFEREEPYIGALAIFLLGNLSWNFAWVFYLFVLVLIYLLVHMARGVFNIVLCKKDVSGRISFYWFWMTVAIFVLLTVQFFQYI